jgi:hypothetical protein
LGLVNDNNNRKTLWLIAVLKLRAELPLECSPFLLGGHAAHPPLLLAGTTKHCCPDTIIKHNCLLYDETRHATIALTPALAPTCAVYADVRRSILSAVLLITQAVRENRWLLLWLLEVPCV